MADLTARPLQDADTAQAKAFLRGAADAIKDSGRASSAASGHTDHLTASTGVPAVAIGVDGGGADAAADDLLDVVQRPGRHIAGGRGVEKISRGVYEHACGDCIDPDQDDAGRRGAVPEADGPGHDGTRSQDPSRFSKAIRHLGKVMGAPRAPFTAIAA